MATDRPLRSCIGCRAQESSHSLLRVVADAGEIIPDLKRSLPGRGAWVHYQCVAVAIERRAFDRALRQNAPLSSERLQRLINELTPNHP
jgi:predicted RNA-binding protein YlxR (DUF448 family)